MGMALDCSTRLGDRSVVSETLRRPWRLTVVHNYSGVSRT